MQDFLKRMDKKWGSTRVFIVFAVIFIILLAVAWTFWDENQKFNFSIAPQYGVDESATISYGGGYAGKGIAMDSYGGGNRVISPTMPYPSPMPPASTSVLPKVDRKVIQNGSLNLLVKKAEESASAIQKIAEKYEGFVDNLSINEVSEGVKSGNITIRIPQNHFNEAWGDIKVLAVKVEHEDVSSQDVTAQFVDLEAQLTNYKAEEKQYREIMDKAVKTEDILNVAARLAEVRGRIEYVQGQMNYLSRQVDMATISVYLTSEPEVEVFGIVWRPLTVLKQAVKNLLADLADFVDAVIYFIFKLPVLIIQIALYILALWVVWKVLYSVYRKFFKIKN